MSEAPRGPRILTDAPEVPAARLDFGWEREVAPVAASRAPGAFSALGLAAAGVAVLLVGLSALEVANFVAAQFARGTWLGALTLAVAAVGYGLVLWAGLREWRGLLALRAVDRARAAFARGDHAAARAETLAWAARIPAAQPAAEALRGANSLDGMKALLEAGPLAELDRRAEAAGRVAAAQAFAATAVIPSPALDALFFAWRGLRLVREVAVIHGLRPGLAGTLALLRRTLFEAGAVAAADVALDAAARAVFTNPLLEKLAGETGKGAVAARRMLMLARAAARACRIIPS